jgi:hypothetical protein
MSQTTRINRNLSDQMQNFGQETIVSNVAGTPAFVNSTTGQTVNRALDPASYALGTAPLDVSFQLDPQLYTTSTSLLQKNGVPDSLSATYGAVIAATAQLNGANTTSLYNNGVMSQTLVDSINQLRTQNSLVGYNSGSPLPPYLHNPMLSAKISAQTR